MFHLRVSRMQVVGLREFRVPTLCKDKVAVKYFFDSKCTGGMTAVILLDTKTGFPGFAGR